MNKLAEMNKRWGAGKSTASLLAQTRKQLGDGEVASVTTRRWSLFHKGGNTIRRAYVAAAVMVVSAASLPADIRMPQVYRNDFSTRESIRLGGFPGAWIETPSGTYPALTTSSPSVILCDSVGKYSTSVHGSEYDAFATCDGITSISIVGSRMPYQLAGDAGADSPGMLVDNISISVRSGTAFIVR